MIEMGYLVVIVMVEVDGIDDSDGDMDKKSTGK